MGSLYREGESLDTNLACESVAEVRDGRGSWDCPKEVLTEVSFTS